MTNKRFVAAALCAGLSMTVAAAQTTPQQPATQARLAAAVLAESRGDYTEALRELEAALTTASNDEQAKIRAALAALQQRIGRPAGLPTRSLAQLIGPDAKAARSAQDPRAADPALARLIAELDTGSRTTGKVAAAFDELESLGALAVPALLAELPNLGPFGLRNVLQLVIHHDDASVRNGLRKLLARQDASVDATLAALLEEMARDNAVTVAQQLAAPDHDADVRLAGFLVLARNDGDPQLLLELAQQLVETPALHVALLSEAMKRSGPWTERVFASIAERGEGGPRAWATEIVLLRTEDLSEDQALAAMAKLDGPGRVRVATALAPKHRSWVRVGLLALPGSRQDKAWASGWFNTMEWWRRPDEAVEALLALPREALTSVIVRQAIDEIVRSGWRLPPRLEPDFVRFAAWGAWPSFVAALPDDAEARAIAVWERSGPSERYQLVHAVRQSERPWHELIVHHLASIENPKDLETRLLQRDWSGMSAETTAKFAELVARWQTLPASPDPQVGGRPTGTAATMASFSNSDWRQALCTAAQQGTGTPLEILMPMVRAQVPEAWAVLASRDPVAALDEAARWQNLESIANGVMYQAARHGDRRHLEVVVAAIRSVLTRNQNWQEIESYLRVFGAGEPVVIALARKPEPAGVKEPARLYRVVAEAARGARVRDLDELLALLPELSHDHASKVLEALSDQLRQEHAPSLLRALSVALAGATDTEPGQLARRLGRIEPVDLCQLLLWQLVGLRVEAAVPLTRQVLADPGADDRLVRTAACACVRLVRADRAEVLAELMADPRVAVVQQVLAAADLRDDETLRQRAFAAILRHADQLQSLDQTFAHLVPDDQVALATSLLAAEDLPRLSPAVCLSALAALGDRKDGALAATMARAATHPDASVRAATATALGRTFAKEAAPFLIEMLKDDETEIRTLAAKGLEAIGEYLDAREKWQQRLK